MLSSENGGKLAKHDVKKSFTKATKYNQQKKTTTTTTTITTSVREERTSCEGLQRFFLTNAVQGIFPNGQMCF